MVTAEIPSLYPEVVEAKTPPGRGRHGYYRRRSDGWIVTAGAWPSFRADMDFKGYQYLDNMPTFLMSFGDNERESNQVDLRGRHFFPHKEPWRLIFQAPGGTALFTMAQIIAYRWHLRPPYREVVFPQLEGVMVYDLLCPECDKGIFSSTEEQEAADMLRIHLTSKVGDNHQYRPEDLRALGEEFGIDFFAARRRHKPIKAVPLAEPAPELEAVNESDVPLAKTRACPECGEEVQIARFQFARHVKAHKKLAP